MQSNMNKVTGNVDLTDNQIGELQGQVNLYYNHAIGYQQGELGTRARIAWDYYYGRLPEPVTAGSSSWIDRSVWEAVNGTLQELVSVFTSGEDAVRFSPINAADANDARAATKMVNQIVTLENQGYNVLHDAFKECLVTRNSFVKRYWAEDIQLVLETFEDLTKDQFDLYLSQLDGEIVEMTTEEDEETELFSGEVTYERKKEGVRIEFVPFEQVIIEPTATSLKDCNYIAHRVRKSKDELLDMGFCPEFVKGLHSASSDIQVGVIANARINNLSPMNVSDVLATGDEHADKLWLHENYIKTSVLGHLEILQVFTLHNQIIEVNRVNEFPFETFTPFPIPGSLWGESVFDITKDIQDLTTSLVRGIIDNIQNANFRRYQAVKGAYDRQSLLNNRPGGVIEVQQIGAVTPFEYHQLPGGVVDLLSYVEGKKEERTGVTKLGQGLNESVFKSDNAFATVNLMMSAAQNRLRMIARNIAQRGMMELMHSVYELVRQNGKEPIVVSTAKGEITIDPRTLPPREKLIVNVAIGTAERKERAANLQAAMMAFNQVPQLTGFFQPENAYFLGLQMLESMGLYDVENFLTPQDKLPPPQPNPAEQMQLQLLQEQINQLQAQSQKLVTEVQNEAMKMEFEQTRAADEMNMKLQESLSKQDKMADEMSLEERRLVLEERRIELEKEKIELKRQEMLIEAQLEAHLNRPVGLGRS